MLFNDAAAERLPHILLFILKTYWQSEQRLTDGETKKAERWTDLHENRKQIRNRGLTVITFCNLKCYCLVTRFKKTQLKHPSSLVLQILGVTKKHFIKSSRKKIVLTVGSGTYCVFQLKPLCKQIWHYHPLMTMHSGVDMRPPIFGP